MSAAPPERRTLPPGVTAGGSEAQSLQRRLHILKIAPTMLPNATTKMAALHRLVEGWLIVGSRLRSAVFSPERGWIRLTQSSCGSEREKTFCN